MVMAARLLECGPSMLRCSREVDAALREAVFLRCGAECGRAVDEAGRASTKESHRCWCAGRWLRRTRHNPLENRKVTLNKALNNYASRCDRQSLRSIRRRVVW